MKKLIGIKYRMEVFPPEGTHVHAYRGDGSKVNAIYRDNEYHASNGTLVQDSFIYWEYSTEEQEKASILRELEGRIRPFVQSYYHRLENYRNALRDLENADKALSAASCTKEAGGIILDDFDNNKGNNFEKALKYFADKSFEHHKKIWENEEK